MIKFIFCVVCVILILIFIPEVEWKIFILGLIGIITGSYLCGQLSQQKKIHFHQQQEIHHFQKRLSDNRWVEMQNEAKKK